MQQPLEITDDLIASNGKRFANYIIDAIVKYGLRLGLSGIAYLLLRYHDSDGLMLFLDKKNYIMQLAIGYCTSIVYYTCMEMFIQRTVGKYITGTKVVMQDGSIPSAGTILLRSLCRCIPLEPLSFFGYNPGGWHDRMTKTAVVNVKKYEEALHLKNSFDEIGAEDFNSNAE